MSTQTAERIITYRRTRQGEWVACGPADTLTAAAQTGAPIRIHRKDGTFTVRNVDKVGRTFGDGLCYGYLTPEPRYRERRTWADDLDNPYETD